MAADGGTWTAENGRPSAIINLPTQDQLLSSIGEGGLLQLVAEADEIAAGRVRLFGGDPVPLNLTPPGELPHWTEYELGQQTWGVEDPKFTWEPTRFGWAFTLGRAYYLTKDERYPEAFWRYFEVFQRANPVNKGPNWASAQEVALRLMAFVFAAQVFAASRHSTAARNSSIACTIADHASRIPPTLLYARAQNNNHLLSEAAGLITASLALSDHPDASRWSNLGWKWFNRGLETQIAQDGTYTQHSTNYHRLMLQLVLWVHLIQQGNNLPNRGIRERGSFNVQRAIRWLLSLTDVESGRALNLGPNDGAYILPLTVLPYHDYRPVLQAASQAFWGKRAFDPGPWDEMSLWFCPGFKDQNSSSQMEDVKQETRAAMRDTSPVTLRAARSWAYLRTAEFHDRPGHADQLHLDLWWRGLNVAQDAGTYLYNALPPWENALTHTAVHNTVMVDGCEQMTRAGRFLYLDWAQAEVVLDEHTDEGALERVIAQHDGYRRLGVTHQRSVVAHDDDRWVVEDQLIPASNSPHLASHTARLHWLLPDWRWTIDNSGLEIELLSPYGLISLSIRSSISNLQPSLIRAGEVLYGDAPAHPNWGWVSPTYGHKSPALSFSVTAASPLPITFSSEWAFPSNE